MSVNSFIFTSTYLNSNSNLILANEEEEQEQEQEQENNSNNNFNFNNNSSFNNSDYDIYLCMTRTIQSYIKKNKSTLAWMDIQEQLISIDTINWLRINLFSIILDNKQHYRTFNYKRAQWLYFWLQNENQLKTLECLHSIWSQSYFDPFVNGSIAQKRLNNEASGTSIIRLSSTYPGKFAISVKYLRTNHNYITITQNGFIFEDQCFDNLVNIIEYLNYKQQFIFIPTILNHNHSTNSNHNQIKPQKLPFKKNVNQVNMNMNINVNMNVNINHFQQNNNHNSNLNKIVILNYISS
eukprot:TRINITY_DN632_c0_g1_i1.p1 TRINITY_DN632_c0_g1~~TRINITY_DN632_c0_g1_i1.p1  ORF type:complete len:295 (+),score=74.65 TRINITY_DN632_c0_g1_i1:90-974(+)